MSTQLQLLPATPPAISETALRLDEIIGWERASPTPRLIENIRQVQRVLEPVIVVPTTQGKYRFGEGRRRTKALAILIDRGEWERPLAVPAVVMSAPGCTRPAIRAAAVALAMHGTRSESPASELHAIETILQAAEADDESVTVKQIAAETGMSSQTIYRRLRLHTLIAPLRRAFDRGEIGATVAAGAARLGAFEQEAIARTLSSGQRITAASIRERTRGQTRDAADSLPASLFVEREPPWWVSVAGHLEAALRGVPTTESQELVGDIERLLRRVHDTSK